MNVCNKVAAAAGAAEWNIEILMINLAFNPEKIFAV